MDQRNHRHNDIKKRFIRREAVFTMRRFLLRAMKLQYVKHKECVWKGVKRAIVVVRGITI
jgi:hypothetical protein